MTGEDWRPTRRSGHRADDRDRGRVEPLPLSWSVGALPVIRVVGVDPATGREVTVRLAPDRLVVTDGVTVAALEDRDTAFGITLERALQLLERERGDSADGGTAGVREPRRPRPPLGTLGAALDLPEEAAG